MGAPNYLQTRPQSTGDGARISVLIQQRGRAPALRRGCGGFGASTHRPWGPGGVLTGSARRPRGPCHLSGGRCSPSARPWSQAPLLPGGAAGVAGGEPVSLRPAPTPLPARLQPLCRWSPGGCSWRPIGRQLPSEGPVPEAGAEGTSQRDCSGRSRKLPTGCTWDPTAAPPRSSLSPSTGWTARLPPWVSSSWGTQALLDPPVPSPPTADLLPPQGRPAPRLCAWEAPALSRPGCCAGVCPWAGGTAVASEQKL